MLKSIIYFLLLIAATVQPQSKDAQQLIEKVKTKFEVVKDYTVDIQVDLDVTFLKTPKVIGTLYYKQPDKVRIKSEGFALLPREGFNFSPAALLKDDYTAIYEDEYILEGVKVAKIKIVPLGNTQNVILSTVWVDLQDHVIRRIESTTKTSGTFIIKLSYNASTLKKYPLPERMDFNFDINRMNIPKGFGGDSDDTDESKKKDKKKITNGSVTIQYSNYKVNTGLSDDMFNEEKKKSKTE